MMKFAMKFAIPIVLVAIGVVSTHVPWLTVAENAQSWYNEPSITEFQELFVSKAGTVYTSEEFLDLASEQDRAFMRENHGVVPSTVICPKTGSTEFQRIIGRVKTDFWGNAIGFELAETYQARQRIIVAKGDMNWAQLFELAQELKDEEEAAEISDVATKTKTKTLIDL